MRKSLLLAAAALLLTTGGGVAMVAQAGFTLKGGNAKALTAAVAVPTRSDANKARDKYRHPVETLDFFGVAPSDTVVEYSPGAGGWYTEILAPYLAAKGTLYEAQASGGGFDKLKAKLDGDPKTYGKVKLVAWPLAADAIPDGSADKVLTFRNVHNMIMAGGTTADDAFASFYRVLKPGGVLGVVDHRLPEARDDAAQLSSGYIKRSTILKLAEKAGFKLVAESEINANPKDTADWEKGVWTLPPSLRNGDVDREKYLAIGESDRMTLKFVKPAK